MVVRSKTEQEIIDRFNLPDDVTGGTILSKHATEAERQAIGLERKTVEFQERLRAELQPEPEKELAPDISIEPEPQTQQQREIEQAREFIKKVSVPKADFKPTPLPETITPPVVERPPAIVIPPEQESIKPVGATISPELGEAIAIERRVIKGPKEVGKEAAFALGEIAITRGAGGVARRAIPTIGRIGRRTIGKRATSAIGRIGGPALAGAATIQVGITARKSPEQAAKLATEFALFATPLRGLPKAPRPPSLFGEGPAPDVLRVEVVKPKLPTKAQLERITLTEALPGVKGIFKAPTRAAIEAERARQATSLFKGLPGVGIKPPPTKPLSLLEPLTPRPAFRIVEEVIPTPAKVPFTRTKVETAKLLKTKNPFDKSFFVGETSIKARINPNVIRNLPKQQRERAVRIINKVPKNRKQLDKQFKDLRKLGIEVTPPSKRGTETAKVLVTTVGKKGEEVIKFITTEAGALRQPDLLGMGRRGIGRLGRAPKTIERGLGEPTRNQKKILAEFDLRASKARLKGIRESLIEAKKPKAVTTPKRKALLIPKPSIKTATPEKILEKEFITPAAKITPKPKEGFDITPEVGFKPIVKIDETFIPRTKKPIPTITGTPSRRPPKRPPPTKIPPKQPPKKPPRIIGPPRPPKRPPTRKPPVVPPFGAIIELPMKGTPPLFEKPKKKKKKKPKFAPSLLGIETGKVEKGEVEKKLFTGLGVRGLKK